MREISQRFNAIGWIGIICLLAGPVLSGYAYAGILALAVRTAANPYTALYASTGNSWILMMAGLAMSLLAFPLIVVGRTYEIRTPMSIEQGSNARTEPVLDRRI
ncbi:hypothetical protein D5400_16955 [Georhizobium profundi]|uniref:Uncharacterized protein n=1 Tax=Georhizobium profundi TaxID=2341112 RepID=A0A3Q8XRV6_9HYPH|nr:hypothetical protein D5400_16955 [Georhizobium profundi]